MKPFSENHLPFKIFIITLSTSFFLFIMTLGDKEKTMIEANLSGMWYPKDKISLNNSLKQYFSNAQQIKNDPSVKAIIAPHAGYLYSGQNASYAFKTIEGNTYKRVIVIGPGHHTEKMNTLFLPKADTYQTPLGDIEIDQALIKNLLTKTDFIQQDDLVFQEEHSVDNEIPFIQFALKENKFKILPVILSYSSPQMIEEAAKLFKNFVDDQETLFVISSDFTHFGSRFGYKPFHTNIENNLKNLDLTAAKYIALGKKDAFWRYVEETKATICGRGPIYFLLSLLDNKMQGEILKYDTSGQMSQDFSLSVSYVSLIFKGPLPQEKKMSPQEQQKLLQISRTVLEKQLKENKKMSKEDFQESSKEIFQQKSGGFVTLKKGHELRGCIGEILPMRPLIDVIIDRTQDAAFHDGRFTPVTLDELNDITIEISVLTPPQQVDSYNEIILGKHGIILQKNGFSAVFLPQVATEQNWDLPTTLSHLAYKAGLTSEDWKEGATFQIFEAIVFNEKDD